MNQQNKYSLDRSMLPVLLGLDTGNKVVKTAHSHFLSGLEVHASKPGKMPEDPTDLIQYAGRYYQLSHLRVSYQENKTVANEFLILTMLAIAKELRQRRLEPRQNVVLSVGLPPGHLYREDLRREYRRYFLCENGGHLEFICGGQEYVIDIVHIFLDAQCYAGVMTLPRDIIFSPRMIVFDIGGYTTDILLMMRGKIEGKPNSAPLGLIKMYSDISVELKNSYGRSIDEEQIDNMIKGDSAYFEQKHVDLVLELVRIHIRKILAAATESGLDLRSSRVVFMGGGSILLQSHIKQIARDSCGELRILEDIRANAKGYEVLAANKFQNLLVEWNSRR